jgi:hypothetical protein
LLFCTGRNPLTPLPEIPEPPLPFDIPFGMTLELC